MARRKGKSKAKAKVKVRATKPKRKIKNTYIEKVIVVTASTKR